MLGWTVTGKTDEMTTALFTDVDLNSDPELDGLIAINSDYRVKDLIKAVPGAKWNPDLRVWTVPLSWTSCLALRAELGDSLRIGPDLMKWATTEKRVKTVLADLRNRLEVGDGTPEFLKDELGKALDRPGFKDLYPYQLVGAVMIRLARSLLLLDETGTGKTRTALAGLALVPHRVLPVLVVCPKTMVGTWAREIAGFYPDAEIRAVSGSPTVVRKLLEPGADFYVINYDLMRRYSRLAPFPTVSLTADEKKDREIQTLRLRAVIADEAHRIANPAAKQTRAVWQAMNGPDVVVRLGLTGTPIQDSPEQLWSPLHAIAPREYGTKTSFVTRFTRVEYNAWGGREIKGLNPTTTDEFNANFATRTRRITKAVALPFLPDKVFETRWVELPASARKAYESMKRSLVAELEKGTVSAGSVLERALRLTQMANSGLAEETDPSDPDKTLYRMVKPSPKLEAFLTDLEAGDYPNPIAVFSDSRQLADMLFTELERKGEAVVLVTGEVTGEDRDDAIARFQAGLAKIIVFTRAGGEGVTLTAADSLIRLFRSWSYTVHQQVEDRVHRIGSEVHDSITIIDYLTENTVEEQQIARLMSKESKAQEVLRDWELLAMLLGKKPEGEGKLW